VTFGAVFSKTPDPLSLPHRRRLCSEHFIENTLMLFSLFLQFVASGFYFFVQSFPAGHLLKSDAASCL